jgi:predicted phosphodiesterase
MAKPHSTTMLAFGDVHIPHQNPRAVEVFCRAAERLRPDLIVCLGDLLDCGQFSTHPPTFGVPETEYVDDLRAANTLLDRLQKVCGRLVMVEGNHEYRLDRWAAAASEGRGAYSMLAPRIQLTRGRARCTYVPYGSVGGTYPHYAINRRIIAVHGWSYARNATKQHLQISQGRSVIHGHCLPTDYEALTDGGWKRIVDVRTGETVLGYQRGQIIKTRVLDTVFHQHWSGRMAVFDHFAIRQTMTELHGIYTRDDQYLHVRDAANLPVNSLVRRALPVQQRSARPDLQLDELRLLVATCSDAHFDERWRNIRFHFRKPRKIKRLTALLKSLGYDFSVRPSSTYSDAVRVSIRGVSRQRLWSLLDGRKVLPTWLAELDAVQMQVVVEELKLWDGSALSHSGKDYGCRQFASHKPEEIDLVQRLLALTGQFSSLNSKRTAVTYNEFRESAKSTKRLGEIVQWQHVSRVDTACLSTETRNFICRTPAGSVELTGNTHRADACIIQNIWSPGAVIQARSAGCLCKPVPLYGTGRPVEWVNAFILGYLGRRSDTLYTIPIMDDRCILPDGTEVSA